MYVRFCVEYVKVMEYNNYKIAQDIGNLNALDLYMEMITMFANATQEQLNIIQNTEGHQRVCAVPGSGKTFSIGCTRAGNIIKGQYCKTLYG